MNVYLHFLPLPLFACHFLCYLQQGVTPVMLAAGEGHTDIVDLLIHKYKCSLTEVTKVGAFDILGCQSYVGVSCQGLSSF